MGGVLCCVRWKTRAAYVELVQGVRSVADRGNASPSWFLRGGRSLGIWNVRVVSCAEPLLPRASKTAVLHHVCPRASMYHGLLAAVGCCVQRRFLLHAAAIPLVCVLGG